MAKPHDPSETLIITRGELEDLVANSDLHARSSLADSIIHRHSAERFDSYPWGPNEHPFGAPNRTPRGQTIAQFALQLHHKFGYDLAKTVTALAATTNIWDRLIELRNELISTTFTLRVYVEQYSTMAPEQRSNSLKRLQDRIDQLGVEQEVAKKERAL